MVQKPIDEKAVFNSARCIASPEDRMAYLHAACGDDADARRRLVDLLRVYDQEESFLESPLVVLGAAVDEPVAEAPGTGLGPYRLLEQIGEGGFGVVFMAEQQQPVRRKVALKVLKPGMDTRQIIARFEAERQALALMDHPNIARVLDAGQTASGRPFFVMDLVKGIPITQYCDQAQLTTRERLELFIPVCQAVQHAHQKGIIHRDIKPSNVLVTVLDGVPVPKVIDFGIAKATGEPLTDRSLVTGFAQMIGTPMYMSPEQAVISAADVDTRSDVYSLGVLLYELLTGTTPFDKERFKDAGYDEMRRIIREEEPPKPSTRLSTLGQAATTLSVQRKSDPRKLSQLFRGELDWIVMKCLEKDRNRRYESANSLARDIERYLHDEPVQACPPSTWYRFRKYARRNKALLAIASVICVALLAGIAGLVVSNVLIGKARQRAEDKRDLALHVVEKLWVDVIEKWLQDAPGLEQRQRDFALEVLEFYQRMAQEEAGNPDMQAEVAKAHFRLAMIHDRLGNLAQSEAAYIQAANLFGRLTQADPSNAEYRYWQARRLAEQGDVCDRLGRWKDADNLAQQAFDLFEKAAAEFPEDNRIQAGLADCCVVLGTVNFIPGPRLNFFYFPDHAPPARGVDGCVRLVRRALGLYPQVISREPTVSDHRWRYCRAQKILSQLPTVAWAERENLARASVAGFRALIEEYSREHRPRAGLCESLSWWGMFCRQVGRPAETEAADLEAVAIAEQLVKDYPNVPYYCKLQASVRGRRGWHLAETDRLDEAEPLLAQAAAALENVPPGIVPPFEPLREAALLYCTLGVAHGRTGRVEESIRAFKKAVAVDLHTMLAHPDQFTFWHGEETEFYRKLARIPSRAGRPDYAVEAYREVIAEMAKLENSYSTDPMGIGRRADLLNSFGLFLRTLDRCAEADQAYTEALAILEKVDRLFPMDPRFRRLWVPIQGNRAVMRNTSGKAEEAIVLLGHRVDWLTERLALTPQPTPDDRHSAAWSWSLLADNLDRFCGRVEESIQAYKEAIDRFDRLDAEFHSDSRYRRDAHYARLKSAWVFQRAGRIDEANRVSDEAVEILRRAAEDGNSESICYLALSLSDQGMVRWRTGRLVEGARALDEAVSILRQSMNKGADANVAQLAEKYLAWVICRRARLHEHLGRLAEAEADYLCVVAIRQRIKNDVATSWTNVEPERPTAVPGRQAWAGSLVELCLFHRRHGQATDAARCGAEAQAIYEETAAHFPWHPDALAGLAAFLVTGPIESLRDPERALRIAKKAVAVEEKFTTVSALGKAQFRHGDYAAAKASLDLVPRLPYGHDDPDDRFFRAMARWQLGDKKGAREDYDEAVRLIPYYDHQWATLKQYQDEAAALLGVGVEKTKK